VRLPSRFDPEVSVQIERAAARAWPADEVEEVEGWVLRRTVGVPRRRSNSLLPSPKAGLACRTLDLALATAEDLDFDLVVQVSPAELHLRLDEALEDRGMQFGGASLVLAGELAPRRPALELPVELLRGRFDVALGELDGEWVAAWADVAGVGEAAETANLVLSQLGDAARFATVFENGDPVAVGIGVVDAEWLGVFSLAVAPSARRRGIAGAVMDALEGWGRGRGARRIYLQVEADNEAALEFYARRGMAIAHSYHYRS
jgi:N-acetylglutamate synthase